MINQTFEMFQEQGYDDSQRYLQQQDHEPQEREYELVGSFLNQRQQIIGVVVLMTSSLLSIFGTLSVLYMTTGIGPCSLCFAKSEKSSTATRRRTSQATATKKQPYHRIMAGMSLAGFVVTTCTLLQPWLLPSDDAELFSAIGNTTSCSVLGFVYLTSLAAVGVYNGCLGINFVLTVVYNWSNEKIHSRFERFVHFIAWIWPLSFTIQALSTQNINPEDLTMTCLFEAYPVGCTPDDGDGEMNDGEYPCTRGDPRQVDMYHAFMLGTLYFTTILAVTCTIILYRTFRKQLKANQQFDFSSSCTAKARKGRISLGNNSSALSDSNRSSYSQSGRTNDQNGDDSTNGFDQSNRSDVSTSSGQQDRRRRRRRSSVTTRRPLAEVIAFRAIFYTVTYANILVWPGVMRIVANASRAKEDGAEGENLLHADDESILTGQFVLLCIAYWFLPLQGFLNLLVYIRPAIYSWRAVEPEASFVSLFVKILSGETAPSPSKQRAAKLRRQLQQQEEDKQKQLDNFNLAQPSTNKITEQKTGSPTQQVDASKGEGEAPRWQSDTSTIVLSENCGDERGEEKIDIEKPEEMRLDEEKEEEEDHHDDDNQEQQQP